MMLDREALELIDHLIYNQTGKYLNDLEREVFIGAWKGRTYSEIYPENPEYVEKYVGYKLWKKISSVLGEKVTKKNLRGALERSRQRQSNLSPQQPFLSPTGNQQVVLCYYQQNLNFNLIEDLSQCFLNLGYGVFLAQVDVPNPGAQQDWLNTIDLELANCAYFLLFLSPQAALSEMITEAIKKVKELRETRNNSEPKIISIRVNFPLDFTLNHDLRSYLNGNPQLNWNSPQDTPKIQQQIIHLLSSPEEWQPTNTEEWEAETPQSTPIVNPYPVAEPELPKGQVRLASAFYIERIPYERQCYEAILQPGIIIRIKAPRQMGKTSLMARILYQAREQGYRTVPLSFQHADSSVFTNLNQILRWFCAKITRKLKLSYQIDDFWTDTYGSKDNCTAYFEDCLLSHTPEPLVLGLDEVDRIFQHPKIADDFFGLLRAWHEDASYGSEDSSLWEKLRLVVVHSTEVYIPLDVNQSPFNVGLPIELSEFSYEQVQDLANRHQLQLKNVEIEHLMEVIGGHPYLVRLALYYIAQGELSFAELLATAATESGIYGDHLRRHLWNLQQHPNLAQAFAKVVTAQEAVEIESILAFKLHSMGLVHLRGNEVSPRFELYRQYFCDRQHLIP